MPELDDFIPGIDRHNLIKDDKIPIYKNVSEDDRSKAVFGMRLASPDHYRLYFALALPTSAPREGDYEMLFLASRTSRGETLLALLKFAAQSASPLGSRLEVLMDRLRSSKGSGLDAVGAGNLFLALSDALDDPGVVPNINEFLGPQLWRDAEGLIPTFREKLDAHFMQVACDAFEEGRAIEWLVSLFRTEIFAHGRFGDQRRPEDHWMFSDLELDKITHVFVPRLAHLGIQGMLNLRSPLQAVYAWLQSGKEEMVRSEIDKYIKNDNQFLHFLDRASSITQSSAGDYQGLRRDNLKSLLDYDQARQRADRLAERDDEIGNRAKVMKARFDAARY